MEIPLGAGQAAVLPVLAMTLGFSKMTAAVMIPSRKAGDLLAGMWELIGGWGKVPRRLVWDRESAIGGTGKLTVEAAGFAGTLGVKIDLAPRRDPEFKGMIERRNGYFETSFLPGRTFTSPHDFNAQFDQWLTARANVRRMRVIRARPVDLFDADRAAMVDLPPVAPAVGLSDRVRLGRDYYVRVASCDYSVDPRAIGRFVDVIADPDAGGGHLRGAGRGRPPPVMGQGADDHRPGPQARPPASCAPTSPPSAAPRPPGPTLTGTWSRSAPCRTTTRCSASTSTPTPRAGPPLRGSR